MRFSCFKDARYFQLSFQSVLLCYGICYLHWNTEWWLYACYFTVTACTQLCCEILSTNSATKIFSRPWRERFGRGMPSALITAFGLSLLLKTNEMHIAVIAAIVAIASKYLLKAGGKHIFNPSALAIVMMVYFTDNAWISTGQWGSNVILLFGVSCLGIIVVSKVQKLDLSLSFLGTYAALLYVRQIVWLGWPMDFFVQSVSTGSLLVFSFFMITDPKTVPDHPLARIIWAAGIAAGSFYLSSFHFIDGAPVLVLVLAQTFVPALNRIFKAEPFNWLPAPATIIKMT